MSDDKSLGAKMPLEDRIKLCRIVGVLLVADGSVESEEAEFLDDLMTRLDLGDDEREEVLHRIESGTEVLGDAATLREHGATLLDELQSASAVDGIIASQEVDLIQMIARVLAGQ